MYRNFSVLLVINERIIEDDKLNLYKTISNQGKFNVQMHAHSYIRK